jgi:hypothetical protein
LHDTFDERQTPFVVFSTDFLEVDSLEERMTLELLEGDKIVAQTVLWVQLYHFVDQVLCLLAHATQDDIWARPMDITRFYILVHFSMVLSLEWHSTHQHLEKNVSHGPRVDG